MESSSTKVHGGCRHGGEKQRPEPDSSGAGGTLIPARGMPRKGGRKKSHAEAPESPPPPARDSPPRSPFRRNSLFTVPPDVNANTDSRSQSTSGIDAASHGIDRAGTRSESGEGGASGSGAAGVVSSAIAAAISFLRPPSSTQPIPMPGQALDQGAHLQIATPNTSPDRVEGRQVRLTRPVISYSTAAQQGFRLMGNKRARLHDDMEDVEWTSEPFEHPLTGLPVWIMILADGHGGVGAPTFFVNRLKELIKPVLSEREWNFDEVDDRNEFSNLVRGIYADMDDEYVTAKKLEYLAWREAQEGHSPPLPPSEAGDHGDPEPLKKPVDDGCTLILNCIYNGYLVNVNVGDSRTALGRQTRSVSGQQSAVAISPSISLSSSSSSTASNFSLPRQRWSLYFSSVDHSPSHPEKALYVSKHGGIFINDNGTRRNVKIDEKRKKPYLDLVGARILRPLDDHVKAIGVSHLRTLNLASTMGDLLYKIPPAVLSCVPDVSFIRLNPTYEYLLVAATDGLWDHLKIQGPPGVQLAGETQAKSLITWTGEEWERISEPEFRSDLDGLGMPASLEKPLPNRPSGLEEQFRGLGIEDGQMENDEDPTHVRVRHGGTHGSLLSQVARRLADREKNGDLYFNGWIRVDDAMVVVAHIRGRE